MPSRVWYMEKVAIAKYWVHHRSEKRSGRVRAREET